MTRKNSQILKLQNEIDELEAKVEEYEKRRKQQLRLDSVALGRSCMRGFFDQLHFELMPVRFIDSVFYTMRSELRKLVSATFQVSTIHHISRCLFEIGKEAVFVFALICKGYLVTKKGISLILYDPYKTIRTVPSKKITEEDARSYEGKMLLCDILLDSDVLSCQEFRLVGIHMTKYTRRTAKESGERYMVMPDRVCQTLVDSGVKNVSDRDEAVDYIKMMFERISDRTDSINAEKATDIKFKTLTAHVGFETTKMWEICNTAYCKLIQEDFMMWFDGNCTLRYLIYTDGELCYMCDSVKESAPKLAYGPSKQILSASVERIINFAGVWRYDMACGEYSSPSEDETCEKKDIGFYVRHGKADTLFSRSEI